VQYKKMSRALLLEKVMSRLHRILSDCSKNSPLRGGVEKYQQF
jgi:hypothetical protein